MLVAPPSQHDEYWERTVIYIYEKGPAGTIGLILNKPSEKSVHELALSQNISIPNYEPVYIGGPVNPGALVMLHTADWLCSNTMPICDNIMISSDRTMLRRIASGDSPSRWRMFLGMSLWAPHQLECEMAGLDPWDKKRAWVTAPAQEPILFGKDPTKAWRKSINLAAQQMVSSYFSI